MEEAIQRWPCGCHGQGDRLLRLCKLAKWLWNQIEIVPLGGDRTPAWRAYRAHFENGKNGAKGHRIEEKEPGTRSHPLRIEETERAGTDARLTKERSMVMPSSSTQPSPCPPPPKVPTVGQAPLLPERLAEARRRRGWSQSTLAGKMDHSPHPHWGKTFIEQWESGEKQPSWAALIKLARLLEVAPEYLTGGFRPNGVQELAALPEVGAPAREPLALPERLTEARQKARLSQQELAHKLHHSRSAINHWETGRHPLSGERLEQIAAVLQVPVEFLTGAVVGTATVRTSGGEVDVEILRVSAPAAEAVAEAEAPETPPATAAPAEQPEAEQPPTGRQESIRILAERVQGRRTDLGMFRRDLAEKVGVHRESVRLWEKGKGISPFYLPRLAAALDVAPEWLTGETGAPEPALAAPAAEAAPEVPAVEAPAPAPDADAPLPEWMVGAPGWMESAYRHAMRFGIPVTSDDWFTAEQDDQMREALGVTTRKAARNYLYQVRKRFRDYQKAQGQPSPQPAAAAVPEEVPAPADGKLPGWLDGAPRHLPRVYRACVEHGIAIGHTKDARAQSERLADAMGITFRGAECYRSDLRRWMIRKGVLSELGIWIPQSAKPAPEPEPNTRMITGAACGPGGETVLRTQPDTLADVVADAPLPEWLPERPPWLVNAYRTAVRLGIPVGDESTYQDTERLAEALNIRETTARRYLGTLRERINEHAAKVAAVAEAEAKPERTATVAIDDLARPETGLILPNLPEEGLVKFLRTTAAAMLLAAERVEVLERRLAVLQSETDQRIAAQEETHRSKLQALADLLNEEVKAYGNGGTPATAAAA